MLINSSSSPDCEVLSPALLPGLSVSRGVTAWPWPGAAMEKNCHFLLRGDCKFEHPENKWRLARMWQTDYAAGRWEKKIEPSKLFTTSPSPKYIKIEVPSPVRSSTPGFSPALSQHSPTRSWTEDSERGTDSPDLREDIAIESEETDLVETVKKKHYFYIMRQF